MIYAVRTGEQSYFKCSCQKCGKHIEFPSNGAGMTVDCPHCGKQTVLGVAAVSSPIPTKSKNTLLLALGLTAVVFAGLGGFLWMQNHKQKEPAVMPIPKAAVAPVTPAANPNNPSPSGKLPASVDTIEDFSVGKITLEKVKGSGLVYAVGTAKNTVDRQRFGVRIELNLLDEQDQNMGVVSDYVSVVEPHKDWQFKALLTRSGVAKATVADIKEQK
jgi:hypothetical protein